MKQTNLQLNLLELIKVEDLEEAELVELIKEEQAISTKPLEIVDVEKKYKLRRIQKKNKFYGTLFGFFSSVITFVALIIIVIFVYRCVRKETNHTQMDHGRGETSINYTAPDRIQLTSTPNTTTT